jgi:hypothetical protein
MSVYGPKIRLPKISLRLPSISIPKPNVNGKSIAIVLVIILILATTAFLTANPVDLNSGIGVYWNNNPLDLKSADTHSELNLVVKNTSETTQNISLAVTTESNEIIVFCPDEEFPNVAPNMDRKTTCIVRRNPQEKIFSGTYNINIVTSLATAKTVLEVKTN